MMQSCSTAGNRICYETAVISVDGWGEVYGVISILVVEWQYTREMGLFLWDKAVC